MGKPTEVRTLVPAADCRLIIEACANASRPCAPEDASALTRKLLAVYPQSDALAADNELYVAAIAATLGRFPIAAATRTASLTKGLPARLKFRPTVADVVEACEAEVGRISYLEYAAKWMLSERERRLAAKLEEDQRAESRRANPQQVDAILSRFRKAGAASTMETN